MQHNRSTLGPRGWAILTLAAGAGLASPFLRPPQIDPLQVDLAERVSESPLASSSIPGHLTAAHGERNATVAVVNPVGTGANSTLPAQGHMGQSQMQIPEWATPPSPLDELISQGTAPPWRHEQVMNSPKLTPLDPWTSLPALAPAPRLAVPVPQPSVAAPPVTVGSLTATNVTSASRTPTPETPVAAQPTKPKQFVYQPGYQQPRTSQAAR
jgi:hypothetical protein